MMNVARRYGGSLIIETDWQWLIRLAWGNRRVSSRANTDVKPYPSTVSASLGLWTRWLLRDKPKVAIVIGGSKKHILAKAPEPKVAKLLPEDIAALLEERLKLRANGEYGAADKIRDKLTSHGIIVSDTKTNKGED